MIIAHQWAHILALSREWVAIPVMAKFIAITLNVFKEECMQKPNVMWVVFIKEVKPPKAGEKGSPASGKVAASFEPHSLDSGVVCRPISHEHIQACPNMGWNLCSPHE